MSNQNLLTSFLKAVERLRHRTCLKYKKQGSWKTLSWIQVRRLVRDLALGLQRIGISHGDRIALLSNTRYEWTIADMAVLSIGGVTVPIYPSSTSEQASYILKNSGAKAVFVEDGVQLDKILKIKKALPALRKVVVFSGADLPALPALKDVFHLTDLLKMEKFGESTGEEKWLEGIRAIRTAQMATIVYTSGTTGPPKGVMLTHRNFMSEIQSLMKSFDLNERIVGLFFLPLAHIFGRTMQFWQLAAGFVHAYGQLDSVMDDLRVIRPHGFVSVPRIFEKIHEKILSQWHEASWLKQRVISWGPFAHLIVFPRIRALFGGRARFAISGGAPLSKEVAEFFHAAGVLILEGYGLTETTAGIYINTEKNYRFGTVGKALPRVKLKLARDGEILVKGPSVFVGYYGDPKATRQAFTRDGWFKTGDIGKIDRDGYLKITDRKKDLIITSAGKNIAPQNIEKLLMTIPYISHAMVSGDGRNFLTALVTLNQDAVQGYARRRNIHINGYRKLAKHPEIYRLVRQAVEEKNRQLASFETIKKFVILENDFSPSTGELTPTLKLKRKVVGEKYKDLIDQLYH